MSEKKVDIKLLKRLCSETSAGLVHCKNALVRADGDYAQALEILKEIGHLIAAKKSDREATDGLVIALVNQDSSFGVILELNCETDFVARNEKFQEFGMSIAQIACQNKIKTKEQLLGESSIEDEIKSQIAVFKENIILSKYHAIELKNAGVIGFYIHNKYTENLGKTGVITAIESDAEDKETLKTVAKNIGIQVVSNDPQGISVDDLDTKIVEEEKAKFQEDLSGKPANIAEKIIAGKLQKFYKEIVLLEQEFFMDPDQTVADYLAEQEQNLSSKLKVISYKKFNLGLDDE